MENSLKNIDIKQFEDMLIDIHYSKLTPRQWQALRELGIVNGFGPSTDPILRYFLKKIAPAFNESSADIHDFTYWQGGDENKRRECDEGFFLRIFRDAQISKYPFYYSILSVLFFIAVRLKGKKYFNYHSIGKQ